MSKGWRDVTLGEIVDALGGLLDVDVAASGDDDGDEPQPTRAATPVVDDDDDDGPAPGKSDDDDDDDDKPRSRKPSAGMGREKSSGKQPRQSKEKPVKTGGRSPKAEPEEDELDRLLREGEQGGDDDD